VLLSLQGVSPEETALCLLVASLAGPPLSDVGWNQGFNGNSALRRLAKLLLKEIKASTFRNIPAKDS